MRTDFVVDVGDVDLRRRPPLQGLGYIAGPDAPCETVSEFHQMARIVSFDLHRRSPVKSIRAHESGNQSTGSGQNHFQLVDTVKRTPAHAASLTGSER